MKFEEAIVYCLATSNRGMRTEQIADMINRQRLHLRKDGQPVTSKQVYAVVCRYPDMFVKAEGRIMLIKSWGQLTCKVISKCGQGDSGDDAGTHIYGESPDVSVLKHHDGVFGKCRECRESTTDADHQE